MSRRSIVHLVWSARWGLEPIFHQNGLCVITFKTSQSNRQVHLLYPIGALPVISLSSANLKQETIFQIFPHFSTGFLAQPVLSSLDCGNSIADFKRLESCRGKDFRRVSTHISLAKASVCNFFYPTQPCQPLYLFQWVSLYFSDWLFRICCAASVPAVGVKSRDQWRHDHGRRKSSGVQNTTQTTSAMAVRKPLHYWTLIIKTFSDETICLLVMYLTIQK